ncbi:unnamed protein product, partial [marine sediment metagenome]
KKDDTVFAKKKRTWDFTESLKKQLPFIAIILSVIILTNAMFTREKIEETIEFPKVGEITTRQYIAPFTFKIKKDPEELAKERAEARAKVLPVLEYDYDQTDQLFNKLDNFIKNIRLLRSKKARTSAKQVVRRLLHRELSDYTIEKFINSEIRTDVIKLIIDEILDNGVVDVLFARDEKELSSFLIKHQINSKKHVFYQGDFVQIKRDNETFNVALKDLFLNEHIPERFRKQFNK